MKKSFFVYIIILLIVVVFFGYTVYSQKNSTPTENKNNNTNLTITTGELNAYNNAEMGYSIRLPGNWINILKNSEIDCVIPDSSDCSMDSFRSENSQDEDIAYPPGLNLIVYRYFINEKNRLEDIFSKIGHISSDFYDYKENIIIGPQEITIAGQQGIRYAIEANYSTEPCYIEEILFRDRGYVFDIEAVTTNKSEFDNNRNDLERLLETFKTY